VTPLQLATMALYVASAGAAVALARRDPGHRPVAAYLTAIVGLDGLRLARAAVLPASDGPRVGWELLVRHVECGAYLASILALPALAVVLFCRWRVGPLVAAGGALWLWLCGSYPELRGAGLMRIYQAVELGGVVLCGGCLAEYLRSPRLLIEGAPVPILSGLALIAGTGAVTLIPRLTGESLLESWPAVVATNATMLGVVLVLQLRQLLSRARAA
jgi:hypothetical protein